MTAFYCDRADAGDPHCYEETYTCAETGEPCTSTLVSCPAEEGPCTTTFKSIYFDEDGNHMIDTEVCHDDKPTCEQTSE